MALMLVEGLNNVPWIVSMPLVSSEGREVARVVRKIKMRPLVYMVFDWLGWGGCDCEEMVVESMDEGFWCLCGLEMILSRSGGRRLFMLRQVLDRHPFMRSGQSNLTLTNDSATQQPRINTQRAHLTPSQDHNPNLRSHSLISSPVAVFSRRPFPLA
jgi:hypothetical protein